MNVEILRPSTPDSLWFAPREGQEKGEIRMSVQAATDGRLSTKGRAARRALLVIPLVLKNNRMPMTYNT